MLILNLAGARSEAGSLVPENKLKRELDAQLPAESRYTFPPVNEKWTKILRYVDPVLKEHKPEETSEEQKKRFDKEEVYSTTGKEQGDRRVLTYAPDGRLRFMVDWRGDDVFTQGIHANGSIKGFSHRRKEKVLEAYTVSPRGSDVHRVVRGNGILKWYSDKPNSFQRVAYHEGVEFFRCDHIGEKLDFVWLSVNKDSLMRWRDGSKEFQNDQAWWGRNTAKGPIQLKRLDGVYDLKKVDAERVKLWEEKYSECIAGFFDRYDAHLKKAGHTWAQLGIEFIRREEPFPGE
jgi:hypothetical protein